LSGVGFWLVVCLGSVRLGFGERYRWSDVPLLLISPFPNINGTLTPTVRTHLVYAVATFRIGKISTLTQKKSVKQLIYAKVTFQVLQTTNLIDRK
jgi:hypothetical protein